MIDHLIAETTDCDFKAAVERSKPKSWLKSVSAFANGTGGSIVFGIEDQDHLVVGLENPQADADFVSETIKTRLDPLPSFSLDVAQENGKAILVLTIRPSSATPFYLTADGRREAYVRIGNQSVIAPHEALNELILRGTHQTWDALDSRIPLERASFTVLKATYAYRTGKDMEDSDFASFGLLTEANTLTNAGALLADEPLVRHSRLFCTRWTGLYKTEPVDDAEFSGSLLSLLREGEAFVKRHNILSWQKTPNSRLDFRSYSERAVTEALVNALVHRSYLELGSEIHVDIYDNRLTISSPGGMVKGPLPADIMGSEIESHRRNPIVCDVFGRMNLMERRGTGLQEICRATAAEDAYRPEFMPKFDNTGDVFRVTLWDMKYDAGSTSIVLDDECTIVPEKPDEFRKGSERVPESSGTGMQTGEMACKRTENGAQTSDGTRIANTGSSGKILTVPEKVPENQDTGTDELEDPQNSSSKLSEREQAVLDYLSNCDKASARQLASRLDMTSRGTRKLLNRLKEQGLIKREGAGRSTVYMLLK